MLYLDIIQLFSLTVKISQLYISFWFRIYISRIYTDNTTGYKYCLKLNSKLKLIILIQKIS